MVKENVGWMPPACISLENSNFWPLATNPISKERQLATVSHRSFKEDIRSKEWNPPSWFFKHDFSMPILESSCLTDAKIEIYQKFLTLSLPCICPSACQPGMEDELMLQRKHWLRLQYKLYRRYIQQMTESWGKHMKTYYVGAMIQ